MDMKIILKEWNKFLVEDKNKRKSVKPKTPSKPVDLTPPTPLPNANAWDGKSAYSYNDAKGLHFFTPGVGWQTIQDRPSKPMQKPDGSKEIFIDRKTAERYEPIVDALEEIVRRLGILYKKCNPKPAAEDEVSKCIKLYGELNRLEGEALGSLNDEEDLKRFEHYYENKDHYRQKLQITPADDSTMS